MLYRNYDYFLAVVDCGSLSKAAETLFISQPALSKYIKKLEADVDIPLFNHNSSPLKLTHAGTLFYNHVKTVLALDQEIQREFLALKSGDVGEVSIGIPTWRSSVSIPMLVPLVQKHYPNIKLNIVEGRGYSLESALLNGQLDFCISTLPCYFPQGTQYEIIRREEILLFANKNHPIVQELLLQPAPDSGHRYFDVQKLNGADLLTTVQGQNLTRIAEQILGKHEIRLKSRMQFENSYTILSLIDQQPCFAFLSEFSNYSRSLPENVVSFTIGDPDCFWDVAIISKKDGKHVPAAQLLADLVKNVYANQDSLEDT